MPGRVFRLSALQRYGCALACVALATILRWFLAPLFGTHYPYLLQFLAVLLVARYLGFGPAVAGLLLGTSPLVFGVELIPRPPLTAGLPFWVALAIVYGFVILLIWILDRQRRMTGEVQSAGRMAAERLEQLDIETEQRAREQQLAAQLRAIVESSEDAIISKDLSGVIRSWNYGAEQIYGYTASETIGKSFTILVSPERRREETEVIERIRQGGRIKHFDSVRLRKDGSPIHVSMTVSPIRDQRGNVVGVSHISRDVTESRKLEDQLRETQRVESLGVLAGGLAHDFNNLLTGVMGNASMVMEELPEEHPAREHIAAVLSASERAALLVRQMLAYAGKGRFVVARLNLSAQVAEIISLLRTSLPRNVRLDLRLAQDLPPLEADPAQLQQVIMNLVINGAEAIGEEPGTVTVTTSSRQTGAEQEVILEVRDTGCGMDDAARARIFDPFYTTKFTGRGLGLSAVLGVVRAHRGFISVQSEPGRGTSFTIVLPAATPGETTASGEPELDLRGHGHLLVVDDEELVRKMARFTLEQRGYTVETAADGHFALELFAARPDAFDAVLLDLTMPVLDGEATLDRMREIRPGVCVVLSSGFSESEALRRFGDRGLGGFLQKPYTAAMLASKIKQAIGTTVTPPS